MRPLDANRHGGAARATLLIVAIALFTVLVVALAPVRPASSAEEPDAATSARPLKKKFKTLKRQVKRLKARVGGVEDTVAEIGPQELSDAIPAAHVTRTGGQAIAESGTVAFNAERYDTANLHDSSANSSRLVAPIDGIYQLTANVWWQAAAEGFREIWFRKNGNTVLGRESEAPGQFGNLPDKIDVSDQVRLRAGDYVEVGVWQTSGSSLSVTAFPEATPEFAMTWLAPGP